jgi:hypothetical protein
VALLAAAHLALVAHFAPRRGLFGGIPLLNDAFAVEAYRAARARLAFDVTGRLWTYDPQILAGQPAGLVEPLGTRVFVLGVALLSRLGARPGLAFNAIVVALHAIFPLVGYAAARAFGRSRGTASVVLALWSGLWFFDALTHYSWFSGRIAFVVASGVVVLGLGCAHRVVAGGPRGWAILAGALGVVTMLLHPLVAIFGVVVSVVASLRATRVLSGRRLTLLIAALVPLLALPLFGGYRAALSSEPLAAVFRPGPFQLFWDLVEVIGPGYGAPGAPRTLVRVLCLFAGVAATVRLRRAGEPWAAALGLMIFGGLSVAYAGAALHVAWPMDPYFFAIPATLAASVSGADLLAQIPWLTLARRGPPAARIGLVLAALVVVPRAVRTVATFLPELLPTRVVRSDIDLHVSALVGLGEPMPDALPHGPVPFRFHDLAGWLQDHAGERGRVLVDEPALSGFLALTVPIPIVGPLAERGSPSRAADPTALLAASPSPRLVEAFLERYAIGWVVLGGPLGPFDRDDPALEPALNIAGFRVRRVASEPRWFAEGRGRIAGTAMGSIRVVEASGPRVTIRFHYDPRLACRPGCRLEAAPIPGDPAGFLSVPDPPQAFEIYVP